MRITQKEINELWNDLEHATTEKTIEKTINNLLTRFFTGKNTKVINDYSGNTDGLIKIIPENTLLSIPGEPDKEISILIETKLNSNFTGEKGKHNRSIVLAQVVYYLRKSFISQTRNIPNAIVIADKNEIFAIPSYFLKEYVENSNYDWTIAPSQAAYQNPELIQALNEDKNLNVYVETLKKTYFSPNEFCKRVKTIALGDSNNQFSKIKVSHDNLAKAFLEFQSRVFNGQTHDTKTQMMIFVKSLLGDNTIYLHPKKKNTIVIESRGHKNKIKTIHYPSNKKQFFSTSEYEAFFTKYDRDHYSLEERKAITEIADTLFEEFDRRFTGDFWTPQIWVDKAHEYIENTLGKDWKEEYAVWDASCGSKNLTRDYKFRELYSSTLHQDELNIAEDYNKGNMAFQYDFLNDDIDLHLAYDTNTLGVDVSGREWKMPNSLIQALQDNKPIVFFMNPPYGQATNYDETEKAGIAKNAVREHMIKSGVKGHATLELYTQFMYRVQLLAETFGYTNDFHVFLFTNKTFLTGKSFKGFRDNYYTKFEYENGFMLNAGEFKGTSSNWGIIFTGWSLKTDEERVYKDLTLQVLESNNDNEINQKTEWIARTVQENLSTTVKMQDKMIKTGYPRTSNGYECSAGKARGNSVEGSLGFFHNNACNIQCSDKLTGLYSMCFLAGNGVPITKENYTSACEAFSIRKSCHQMIKETDLLWVLDKDIFPATLKTSELVDWDSFATDCVIYSLFGRGSNQTALREYEYTDNNTGITREWKVKNEFFWLSPQELRAYCDEYRDLDIITDLDADSPRYTQQYLANKQLSTESQELLNIANQILKESMAYRVDYHNSHHQKYNLTSWDAGWNQIYRMCYSRDAHPMAKQNTKLQELYEEFLSCRELLEAKIAHNYMIDTEFGNNDILEHTKNIINKPQINNHIS